MTDAPDKITVPFPATYVSSLDGKGKGEVYHHEAAVERRVRCIAHERDALRSRVRALETIIDRGGLLRMERLEAALREVSQAKVGESVEYYAMLAARALGECE